MVVLLAACGTAQPTQTEIATQVADGAYPAASGAAVAEAYPSPEIAPAKPQGAAATYNITGTITANGKPLSQAIVYLTPVKNGNTEPPAVLLLPDPATGDVVTNADANGVFVFAAPPPGSYYLAATSTNSNNLATQNEKPILVEVKAEQSQDLGICNVILP